MLAIWIASASALGAGCINPVRPGYPPLTQACTRPSECPRPYDCNDAGCEIKECLDATDCTFESGLTCFGAQCLDLDGG
jgi:hypothetical protein